MVQKKNKLK